MASKRAENPVEARPLATEAAELTLCDADARAVDALLAARWDDPSQRGGDPRVEPSRAARATELLGLMDATAAPEPADDLVARTMQRIAHEKAMLRRSQAPAPAPATLPMIPLRWNELAAVAAMILLGLSLVLPMLEMHRADARRIGCATNLAQAGLATLGYATDYHGELPRLSTTPGGRWFAVGKPLGADGHAQSNSAHYYLLARQGYINPDLLACPNNEDAPKRMPARAHDWPHPQAVSYSYQNQYARQPVRVDDAPEMVVLADRNPLFGTHGETLIYRNHLPADAPSEAHGRRGQNVLRNDGSVEWAISPITRAGDNIWLASGVRNYKGNEIPAAPDDSFLVP